MNLASAFLVARRPSLALDRARAAFRFRIGILPRLRRKDPTAPPPLTVSFNLTHLCNLRCGMCGQWRRQDTGKGAMLSLSELKRIADEIAPFRPKIFIWGGEPLIHPDILPFLDYLKAARFPVVVNTNGVLLERFASDIVRIGVDSLDISLDGPPDVHDRVRGVPGTFERLRAGVEKVGEEARRQGRRPPLLKAISVVTETSQGRLGDLLGLLEQKAWFDMMIVNLGWFTSEAACKANEKAFADRLGTAAISGKDFIGALGTVDPERVRGLMKRASRSRLPVVFRPALPPGEVAAYYARPAIPIRRRVCYAPWTTVDIRPDGSAVFCPDYPDYAIGNVREEPLLRIWNGERAQKFRRSLLDHGLFPICARCCGLYDHGF